MRKTFFDKKLALSVNCRDLLESRKFRTVTSGETFERYQENWRGGRRVQFTATWNFGNMKSKRPQNRGEGDDSEGQDNYNGGGDE